MFITKTGPQPVRTGQDQVLVLDWSGPVPGLRSSMVLVFCGPGPGPFKKWWSSPGPGPWSFQKRQKDRTGPDQPTLVSELPGEKDIGWLWANDADMSVF